MNTTSVQLIAEPHVTVHITVHSTAPGLENLSTWSTASSPKVPGSTCARVCVCVCVCTAQINQADMCINQPIRDGLCFCAVCIMQIWILHGPRSEKRLYPDRSDISQHGSINWIFFNWAVREIHKTDQTENALDTKCVYVCVCVCGHKRERERKEERDWPHKFEGPLGKVCVVLTANLRKMSITLPTSKTFMKASRLYQSLPPRQLPRKYFLSEKISFNYWERGFKFISVFRDFLQMAVQGAVVHIKMILLILTCFHCCKQTDCQKPQICCLQRRCSRCITKTTVCRHTHTHGKHVTAAKHRYDSGRKLETNRNGRWRHSTYLTKLAEERRFKVHKDDDAVDQSFAEAGVLINWTHGESDLVALPWTNPASDSSEQCCISFPAVHQMDRETLSPDLSTSISNTILIPSGSKEAASFASLSLGRNRRPLGNPPSSPGLNDQVWSINSSPLALA